MALPLILSLLGSGLAGAGALGGLGILGSPLIAGAIGSGLGTAIQEKDLGAGIRSGLTAGLLGGLGGALVGGGSGLLTNPATATAGSTVGNVAANEAAKTGLRGMMSRMPSGFSGPTDPTAFNKFMAARGTSEAMAFPFRDVMREGLNQGVLTGAGIGAALPGAMQAMTPTMPEYEAPSGPGREPVPFNRKARRAPAGFRPGIDPEFQYFRPTSVPVPRLAAGGMLNYTPAGMDQPMRMQAGGIADMMPGAEREAAPMNDKDIVAESIRAIRGELPEQEAAIVLGQFLQTYGEEAFRKLVDDVQSGRAGAGGDMEGTVQGPGDGMDDLVPATMDDGSQDVLLSDGEFIVPADVVSGLGNGSTDAGAEELHRMMDRVRQERTGRTEQAPKVAAGGLMPA
ncbi:MAG TPA: hypothetical protein VMV78_00530 [Thiobacillus sp.]|nr:hypothetical protein [Thiobacillus sp.]